MTIYWPYYSHYFVAAAYSQQINKLVISATRGLSIKTKGVDYNIKK